MNRWIMAVSIWVIVVVTGYGFNELELGFSWAQMAKQPIFDLNLVGAPPNVLSRIHGSVGDGSAGVPVAGGHDCDGDGFADVAFAQIQASPLQRSGAGEITLILGNGTIGGVLDTVGFQPHILKIAGHQPFEVAGAEIWIDDVTGDNIGDLLIGRQNYSPTALRPGAGALTIIVGGPALRQQAETLSYLDLWDPKPAVTLLTIVGEKSYDRLGIWLRTGDVTGDGVADIVVGADEVDRDDELNRGAVYVIRGGAHLTEHQMIDLAQFGTTPLQGHIARLNPPMGSTDYHLGATCQVADLDNNGRAEVLAAAALNRAGAALALPGRPAGSSINVGGAPGGALFIAWDDLFTNDLWVSGYDVDLAPSDSVTRIDGAMFHNAFGEEIIGGLDVNGDEKADLFVGDLTAFGVNGSVAGVGHVFYHASKLKGLQFGLDAPPAGIEFTVIEGPAAGAIGADTAAFGDFNGDQIDDLVICNPHDSPESRSSAGSLHILYGQAGNWPPVINLADASLPDSSVMQLVSVYGARGAQPNDGGDTLCYSAASGDLNGDGITDLIVNEMQGNGLGPDTFDVGNMLLISGPALQTHSN